MANSVSAIDRVIDGGFCVGCGACAFVQPDSFTMDFTEGIWKARRIARDASDISSICPMSGEGPNEDMIAGMTFPTLPHHDAIGRYSSCAVGSVVEGEYRDRGGSGGLLTWVLTRLIQQDLVDAVLHVVEDRQPGLGEPLFAYGVSFDQEAVANGAKSRYYPIEMSKVLEVVRGSDKRFAIVGLPCFLKSVRVLQAEGHLSKEQTPFLIGLICGHLKSSFFGELLAWQMGVEPDALGKIDFRVKLPARPASQYGFSFASRHEASAHVSPMADVVGHDWGEGLLKNPACEFCDDVVAECADIAIGDAWLPVHVDDPRGTNVCVVRDAGIGRLIELGSRDGSLDLEFVDPSVVAQSQSSGLRHRREGLAHRLATAARESRWTPRKRVAPMLAPTSSRRKIYDLRERIAIESNRLFVEARKRNDLSSFLQGISPLIRAYHQAYRPSLPKKVYGKVKTVLKRLAGK